ncbi:glutamine-hydrolyzing carbamoyl-phosphate synthase small subunit [Candidatus Daviesbacteria bacterium]|nr:glutamine-hydrolyzing carbamoyl-phosphate synthase small subunit [Candidatus Daviesbacteria bacterium]
MTGKLILSDGTVFLGESFGFEESGSGEVVFNTGMVGYPESLTDPSYFGQILVLTYPLEGSYGVPQMEYWESKKIQVKGLIVQNYIDYPSHFESQKTLGAWLKEEGIPALQGIDTRALTIKLREHGVMLGRIEINGQWTMDNGQLKNKKNNCQFSIINYQFKTYDPNKENVLPFVSVKKVETVGNGRKNIVLIDCGTKGNIIRSLIKRGVKVTIVPWDYDPITEGLDFDGVMVSNGPSDPSQAGKTIENVREILSKNIPTFGICLGSQIMALAAGGQTYKLKFGHRGHNQPVKDQTSKRAIITSQNHGFAVDMKTMDVNWIEWFINLNDGTNEGIRHKNKPFMAVQFHPEASPGPVDAGYLFDEFLSYLR